MILLIPMAGAGSRFQKAGYKDPKFMINVAGKPMIQHVIDNMPKADKTVFLVQQEHLDNFQVQETLEKCVNNPIIVPVNGLTEGAACTCLLAKDFIDVDDELIIANCDQLMDWALDDFMSFVRSKNAEGGILTFTSTSEKNSYVRLNSDGYVCEVAEKLAISDIATCGVYYWSRGSQFVVSAEQMILKNIKTNNEFYVCPVYNEMLDKKIVIFPVNTHFPIGTPEDLKYYLENHHGNF